MAGEDVLGRSLRSLESIRLEYQEAMKVLREEKESAEVQVAHLRKLVLLSPKVVKKALMLEGELARLKQLLQEKKGEEAVLKKEVRKWEENFKRQHEKDPSKTDFHPIKDKFMRISQLEKDLAETTHRIKDLQEKHDKLIESGQLDIAVPDKQSTVSKDSVTVENQDFADTTGDESLPTQTTKESREELSKQPPQPQEEMIAPNVETTASDKSFQGEPAGDAEETKSSATADIDSTTVVEGASHIVKESPDENKSTEEAKEEQPDVESAGAGIVAETKAEVDTVNLPGEDEDKNETKDGKESLLNQPAEEDSVEQEAAPIHGADDEDEEVEEQETKDEKAEDEVASSDANGRETKVSKAEEKALEEAKAKVTSESETKEKVKDKDKGKHKDRDHDKEKDKDKSKDKDKANEKAKSSAADSQDNGNASAIAKRYLNKVKATEKKLKATENKLRETKSKMTRLEKELLETQKQLSNSSGGGGRGGGSGDSAKLTKEMEHLKKKHTKELAEKEKELKKGFNKALQEKDQAVKAAESALTSAEQALSSKSQEVEKLAADITTLQEEVEAAQAKLAEEKAASGGMKEEVDKLEGMLKEEQALRKKYFNMMEDMKGKIRVFARCRPMAVYEKEKKCSQVVSFPDETTISVQSEKGVKEFVYDQCFGPTSTQEEIFEDTRNLIQSSLDGYNVCVFAYGQTGSGKTFTMVGSEEHPGIVRRTISEIFAYMDRNKNKMKLNVKLYMVELYRDALLDLLRDKKQKEQKLEIKKDKKGTVFVKNATIVAVHTAQELLKLFDSANSNRKTASTKMNAASSRSHLVFSLILENTNLATKKTNVGKISLVDLAGSERADKTGATAETLKEAMSINKSLSALGDVISALSTGEKHIPYRNNTLTQLMSDSLGGNAKTLMFVNVSPADYNAVSTPYGESKEVLAMPAVC